MIKKGIKEERNDKWSITKNGKIDKTDVHLRQWKELHCLQHTHIGRDILEDFERQ